jgi:hypothetical protein
VSAGNSVRPVGAGVGRIVGCLSHASTGCLDTSSDWRCCVAAQTPRTRWRFWSCVMSSRCSVGRWAGRVVFQPIGCFLPHWPGRFRVTGGAACSCVRRRFVVGIGRCSRAGGRIRIGRRGGPATDADLRALIVRLARENPGWGVGCANSVSRGEAVFMERPLRRVGCKNSVRPQTQCFRDTGRARCRYRTRSRSAHASAGRSPYYKDGPGSPAVPGRLLPKCGDRVCAPRPRAPVCPDSCCIASRVLSCCTTIASLSQRKGVIVMVQQGQVLQMTSRAADGSALWSYRYRVGGRDSRRVQRGGFASERDAGQALERALERLRRANGTASTLTLARLVDEYLAQHDVRPPRRR